MDQKARFLKTYANLPHGTRQEVVAVVKGEPYSWQAAKLEVEHDTPLGREIMKFLSQLKVLS